MGYGEETLWVELFPRQVVTGFLEDLEKGPRYSSASHPRRPSPTPWKNTLSMDWFRRSLRNSSASLSGFAKNSLHRLPLNISQSSRRRTRRIGGIVSIPILPSSVSGTSALPHFVSFSSSHAETFSHYTVSLRDGHEKTHGVSLGGQWYDGRCWSVRVRQPPCHGHPFLEWRP